jgi:hypothetical protein
VEEFNPTLMMGQKSSPETLVSYQKTKPGKNPKDFIEQYKVAHKLRHRAGQQLCVG